ncbi:hypothetical protein POM88_035100 [Heracleum sosnowskyi]|uniref:TF-B3 domain-containing protein n=1 Tax=Heracleum sosnowskyi TaxID=360622 RepID=A0AAD8HLI3_9APIA|nr:hypothetical protein POM88_035100 [Heracleum sosnowskyi]
MFDQEKLKIKIMTVTRVCVESGNKKTDYVTICRDIDLRTILSRTKTWQEDDDVCVFQLINTKDYTLKLTIFEHTNAGRPENTNLQTAAPSAAEALVPSSEFPAFTKIVKHAYVKSGGCLHVPQHFARKYFKSSTRDVKIEFSDKAGTVMVLRRQPSETRMFLGGWSDLAREKSLQVDDVCVFELIDTQKLLNLVVFVMNLFWAHISS